MCAGVKIGQGTGDHKGELVDFGDDGAGGSRQPGPRAKTLLRLDQGCPGLPELYKHILTAKRPCRTVR